MGWSQAENAEFVGAVVRSLPPNPEVPGSLHRQHAPSRPSVIVSPPTQLLIGPKIRTVLPRIASGPHIQIPDKIVAFSPKRTLGKPGNSIKGTSLLATASLVQYDYV